jgi:hypothetical protein
MAPVKTTDATSKTLGTAVLQARRMRVSLLNPGQGFCWARQMPECLRNSGIEFRFQEAEDTADWLFVFEGIDRPVDAAVAKERRVFVCGEPASIRTYSSGFLRQFGEVWSTHEALDHPNVVRGHPCSPWHVGLFRDVTTSALGCSSLSDLEAAMPMKDRCLSVVTSNKAFTAGHRKRLAFVQLLRREFGDSIDVFGRGINGFDDKWSVLSRYRYHIAIENSRFRDYWTEKLADPLLTYTFPIYCGCPNVHEYFDPGAVGVIDIDEPECAIARIRTLLDEMPSEARLAHLSLARQQLIERYNLLAEIARRVRRDDARPTPRARPERIYPEQAFGLTGQALGRYLHRVMHRLAGA